MESHTDPSDTEVDEVVEPLDDDVEEAPAHREVDPETPAHLDPDPEAVVDEGELSTEVRGVDGQLDT